MHRPVAVADRQPVGGGDRGGDIGLGRRARRSRRSRPLASPAAIADDSVQPVPCVLWVAMRGGGEPRPRRPSSTSRSTLSGAAAVAALDQHRLRRRARAAARACACISRFVARRCGASSSAAASGRFGVTTSARGSSRSRSAVDRVGREQPVAGGRDHHRIEHDPALRASASSPSATASMTAGVRQHADLDRADIEIGEHRVDLRRDEIRRHVVDAGDALGVLRGQRRDHRRAIDAERGEGLQVGLDAGAAAGIRAGDGDGDRRSSRRLARRSARVDDARAGCAPPRSDRSASDSAEITATPSAPAAITSAALAAVMPAMPQHRQCRRARAERGDDRRAGRRRRSAARDCPSRWSR